MNKPFWSKATSNNLGLEHYWASFDKHLKTYKVPPYCSTCFAAPMFNLELFEWRFTEGRRWQLVKICRDK